VSWITFADGATAGTVDMTAVPPTANDSLYNANAYSYTLRVVLASYTSKTIDITFS